MCAKDRYKDRKERGEPAKINLFQFCGSNLKLELTIGIRVIHAADEDWLACNQRSAAVDLDMPNNRRQRGTPIVFAHVEIAYVALHVQPYFTVGLTRHQGPDSSTHIHVLEVHALVGRV